MTGHFLMFKKLLNKTISVVLIILLNYLAFFALDLKPALAYFDDQEIITDNTMSAGTLDLSTNSLADFSPQVTPTQTATRAIDIQNNGSLLLQTNITTANLDGDFDLCANLNLEVLAGATTLYNGTLIGLSSTPLLTPTSTIQTLNFTATLNNNDLALKNKTCTFDLIVNGWQDNIANYGTGGFNDQETLASVITSGSWETTSPPMPPEPPVVPPVLPQFGDVVINELMWMGSQDIDNPSHDGPNDQWIELKNVSSNDLHLKDWYLTYQSNAGNELKLVTISNNRVVKGGEYFLLSYYTKNNSAINVSPDEDMDKTFGYEKFQIKLYASSTSPILIDAAGNGNGEPAKGDKTNFYSMERNDTPGDGANYDNWHTCLDTSSTALYWDAGRTEQGTPGAANLSANDSSYTPDTTLIPSYNPGVVNDPEINPEINNIQDENIIPDEIAVTNEPPVEDLPNQNPVVENALPDTSVSEPETILPDLPAESQQAIEPAPIKIEPADSQNNNSDPNDNNQ